jgi:hypothetical protein
LLSGVIPNTIWQKKALEVNETSRALLFSQKVEGADLCRSPLLLLTQVADNILRSVKN